MFITGWPGPCVEPTLARRARGLLPEKSVLRLGRQIRINRELIEREAIENGRD
jgi:hypothetical protein